MSAGIYNTPGVYVEEIPKFPPSIAPVETAIPAFIGYTEKAIQKGESLFNKPTRISSIAEYELYFGGGASQDVNITLDTNNQFVKAEANAKLYLYDSLRIFYANGGGDCYILSIGKYPVNVSAADLKNSLVNLAIEDEPTLILAPDAVSDEANLYEFQKEAMSQCNLLKDRFTLCDLTRATNQLDFVNSVKKFRDSIGINNLKYGAAYGPWIKANLPRTILHRNVKLFRDGTGSVIALKNLTAEPDILSLIEDVIRAEEFVNTSVAAEETIGAADKSFENVQKGLVDTYKTTTAASSKADVENALGAIVKLMVGILAHLKDRYDTAPVAASGRFKLRDDIDGYLAKTKIKDALKNIAAHHNHLDSLANAADKIKLLATGADLNKAAAFLGFTNGVTLLTPAAPAEVVALYAAPATAKARGDVAIDPVMIGISEAISLFRFVLTTVNNYEKSFNESLVAAFGTFKDLTAKAAEALNVLPPSGAVAGIYAATDRDRGVWKAPANVSVNAVIEPAVKISQEQQGSYNVDVNAGKSINIILSLIHI